VKTFGHLAEGWVSHAKVFVGAVLSDLDPQASLDASRIITIAPIFHGASVARHRRLWETTIRALEAMPEASVRCENRVSLQKHSVATAPSAHNLHAAAGGSVICGGIDGNRAEAIEWRATGSEEKV
jgi:hypothetical protein